MSGSGDELRDRPIERTKVREVAGVFRSRDALEAAVAELQQQGFDRSEIDLMGGADAVRQKLGGIYAPAEELADMPGTPRQAFTGRDDAGTTTATVIGTLSSIGALAGVLAVVASGGALAVAVAAAAAGGVAGGGLGTMITKLLGREQAEQLKALLEAGGLVLWVRVRSADLEQKAQEILRRHGGEAVRVHEIELDKRLEDLPLASVRPDPWLGGEPLGHP